MKLPLSLLGAGIALAALSTTAVAEDCDLANLDLRSFPAWEREHGYWVGEYTLMGADGNAFASQNWNYPYDHYAGFIALEVEGNAITQRNVFLYPPQSAEACEANPSVLGAGACGINGNEKIFSAAQSAVDCSGGLSGPYMQFGMQLDTETRLLGDDTVLYQVRMNGALMQNQLTSLPGNGTRIRTAQGLYAGNPSYASFYRERKVSREEFFELLDAKRADYNILEADHCGFDNGNQPSEISCEQHFSMD